MYKRILIHVDASVQGGHHVRHGLNLARSIGAHPILLHVTHELDSAANQDALPPSAHGLEVLRRERNQARSRGRPPDTRFERSCDVARTILRVADDEECDLIILGSTVQHDANRSCSDSIAEQVFRSAEIPVLIER